jgi:predicted O-methyltransferase YrrM
LLHIDGNHSEEASTSDVDLFMPLVKPGGVVFMDDLNWDSTKRAQEKMLDFCGEPRVEKGEAHCYGVYKKREESEEA